MWVCTPSRVRRASLMRPPDAGLAWRRPLRGDTEIRLLHHRRGDHLGRLAVGHQRAVVQHDDAVGQFAHHVHLVLHQQDGLGLVFLQRADQVQDDGRLVVAHAGGRFVEHVDQRVQRHEQGHLELALVAVRQAGDTGVSCLSDMATAARISCARCVSAAWSLQMLHRFSPRRCGPSWAACTASRTFSSTGRLGNRLVSWKARPRPARVRSRRRQTGQLAPVQLTVPAAGLAAGPRSG
jgi:hypothetical protein